ncbi:hypothetical protein CCHR01_08106 [Colletotrichum chrysophilum]|uniref:Uncharacterized protein n=1 Tax=Colletotrichum chrysophilum TaxID=1836956 RepID=A0AAD9EJ29_9PEZI|nr:hypothetical protein CCHR01_08106 [Colletotrichum chrysophilum]
MSGEKETTQPIRCHNADGLFSPVDVLDCVSLVRNSPAVLHLSKRLAGATKRNERTQPVCCAFRTGTRSSDLFINAEHRLKAKTKARMTSPEIVASEATVTQFPELSLHFPPSPADSTPCTRRAHPDFGDARHSWDGTYQASECHQSIRVRARSQLCGDRQNITRLRINIISVCCQILNLQRRSVAQTENALSNADALVNLALQRVSHTDA